MGATNIWSNSPGWPERVCIEMLATSRAQFVIRRQILLASFQISHSHFASIMGGRNVTTAFLQVPILLMISPSLIQTIVAVLWLRVLHHKMN